MVEVSPETWGIECCTLGNQFIYDYLYDNKEEYEKDLNIIGLN